MYEEYKNELSSIETSQKQSTPVKVGNNTSAKTKKKLRFEQKLIHFFW